MSTAGSLETWAGEFARVFRPLEERLSSDGIEGFWWWMGLRPPDGLSQAGELANGLANGASAATDLVELVADLVEAIDSEDAGAIASAGADLISKIRDVVEAIDDIAQGIGTVSGQLAGLTPAQRAELNAFGNALPERLISRLFVDYLEDRFSHVATALTLVGSIELAEEAGGAADSLAAPYLRKTFHFDRLTKLFSNPEGLLRDVYGWGDPGFDGRALFAMLDIVLRQKLELPTELIDVGGLPLALEAFGFRAEVVDTENPPALDLAFRFPADLVRNETFTEDDWEFTLNAEARFAADVEARLRPLFDVDFQLPSGTADFLLSFDGGRSKNAEPVLIFGKTGGSRLEVRGPGAGVGLEAHWTSATGRVAIEPQIRGRLEGGKVVINGEGGDSLINEVLSTLDIEADFDVRFTWSPTAGLQFEGGAALAIDLAVHAAVGPIRLDALHLGLGFENDHLKLDVGSTVGADLGPLKATVQRLGLRGEMRFPSGGGNLGPVQLDLKFLPPNGVGLAMDTGTVKLGGFLMIDPDNHRYAGAVELSIVDTFDLTAIGLITTRLPDGTDVFSMLFLISMRFPTPIHIAYNFFLAGVGGLLGLHRSVDLDRLRTGLRDGVVDDLLFPTDVVENMNAIVTDLQQIFPPMRDQFLVGPMAQITWNTPPLLTIEMGLILEFANPVRIAILGLIKAAIPTEDEAILKLNVNFLGSIDFEKGLLAFDASIFDSYIGRGCFRFSFEGDLALRISWGAKKDFLTSVGGFHPQYQPPAYLGLPPMRRITISLLKDNPRLTLTSYFALTSNTVQFGAELDFYFSVKAFSVEGNFGFDVLFQFSPFRFIAGVRARLAVKAGSAEILSLSLSFELQGTTPWIASGKASFKILFIKVSVKFKKTWGEQREISLPEVMVLPEVIEEFERVENWNGELATGVSRQVQLLPAAQRSDAIVLDPGGVLTVTQNLVPLDTEISQFGNNKPSDIKKVDVKAVRIGDRDLDLNPVEDDFAPAAYRTLSDADKLKAASYEPKKGGVEARSGIEFETDQVLNRPVTYEVAVSDADPESEDEPVIQRAKVEAGQTLFEPLVPGGAIGRSFLAKQRQVASQARSVLDVGTRQERFAVVSKQNLRAVDPASRSLDRSQAEARLKVLRDAGQTDFEIVPEFERAS